MRSASKMNETTLQKECRSVKVKSLSFIEKMQFLYIHSRKIFLKNTDNLYKYNSKRVTMGPDADGRYSKWVLQMLSPFLTFHFFVK